MSKRVLVLCIILIVIVGFILFRPQNRVMLTEKNAVKTVERNLPEQQEYKGQLNDMVDDYDRIRTFVSDRLLDSNGLLDFEIVEIDKEELTSDVLQDEVFTKFSTSVKHQDVDLLMNSVSSEVIERLVGAEDTIEGRISKIEKSLQAISGNGAFQSLKYRLDKVQAETESSTGIMSLSFSNDVTIDFPFKMQYVEGQELPYYQLDIQLEEIAEEIGEKFGSHI